MRNAIRCMPLWVTQVNVRWDLLHVYILDTRYTREKTRGYFVPAFPKPSSTVYGYSDAVSVRFAYSYTILFRTPFGQFAVSLVSLGGFGRVPCSVAVQRL